MKTITLVALALSTFVAGILFANSNVTETNVTENSQNASATALAATAKPTPTKTVAPTPLPHCEVPCGIYADQMRFEQMLEDTETIAKAITNVNDFASGLEGGESPTGKSINQSMRWVTTKENHATNTQHIVAQYFLTQRIKSDHKDYTGQLATAHKVMVAAMKCKQDSDPATAENLKKAIFDLYRAYEGKEPTFHQEEAGK